MKLSFIGHLSIYESNMVIPSIFPFNDAPATLIKYDDKYLFWNF